MPGCAAPVPGRVQTHVNGIILIRRQSSKLNNSWLPTVACRDEDSPRPQVLARGFQRAAAECLCGRDDCFMSPTLVTFAASVKSRGGVACVKYYLEGRRKTVCRRAVRRWNGGLFHVVGHERAKKNVSLTEDTTSCCPCNRRYDRQLCDPAKRLRSPPAATIATPGPTPHAQIFVDILCRKEQQPKVTRGRRSASKTRGHGEEERVPGRQP